MIFENLFTESGGDKTVDTVKKGIAYIHIL